MSIAQQLQETIERGRLAAQERQRQDELAAAERQAQMDAKIQAHLRAAKLPEWMMEYLSVDTYEFRWYMLALPGCAPIKFKRRGSHSYNEIGVRTPRELYYEDDMDVNQWFVRYDVEYLPDADSLDEAIALAAELGESWHAMHAEAERRNAEGLRPETPPAKPRPQVPSIDELMVSALEKDDGSINALIIIAAELRSLRYALTLAEHHDDRTAESEIAALTTERDGLREQLMEADAANAGLIRELRRLRSWTTDPTVAINEVSGDRV